MNRNHEYDEYTWVMLGSLILGNLMMMALIGIASGIWRGTVEGPHDGEDIFVASMVLLILMGVGFAGYYIEIMVTDKIGTWATIAMTIPTMLVLGGVFAVDPSPEHGNYNIFGSLQEYNSAAYWLMWAGFAGRVLSGLVVTFYTAIRWYQESTVERTKIALAGT